MAQPHPKKAGRRLGVIQTLCIVGLVMLGQGTPDDAGAAIEQRTREPFPLLPGITILYDTNQQAIVADRYWTRVDIVEVWEAGVEFDVVMYGGPKLGTTADSRILTNLQSCDRLDPWWGGPDSILIQDQRCELWIGRDAYFSLLHDKSANFLPDTVQRQDTGVELTFRRYDTYVTRIDGRDTELPVLVIESSLGDEFWIYDDIDNPFVLKSNVKHMYHWEVTDIFINESAPELDFGTVNQAP